MKFLVNIPHLILFNFFSLKVILVADYEFKIVNFLKRNKNEIAVNKIINLNMILISFENKDMVQSS